MTKVSKALESIVSLLSTETTGSPSKEDKAATCEKMAEFLKHPDSVSESGIILEISSMASCPPGPRLTGVSTRMSKSTGTSTGNSSRSRIMNAKQSKSMSSAILQQLIQKGNPLPPKTSYAKGKKKLQKRRRNSTIIVPQTTLDLKSLLNDVDGDEMIKNMSSPLMFKSKKSKGKGNGEDNGEDNGEGQSKEGTTAESNINNDITHAASRLNQNMRNSVHELLDTYLVFYLSTLIHSSMKAHKGGITYEAAQMLAHHNIIDDMCSEEDDDKTVMKNIDLEEETKKDIDKGGNGNDKVTKKEVDTHTPHTHSKSLDDNTSQAMVKTETVKITPASELKDATSKTVKVEDEPKAAVSADGTKDDITDIPKTEQKERNIDNEAVQIESTQKKHSSLRPKVELRGDSVDHVAKITTIHGNSPSLRAMLGLETVKKNQQPKNTSIEKCTTSFSISNSTTGTSTSTSITGPKDENSHGDISVPVQFKAVATLVILKHKSTIEFDSSGIVLGTIDKSQDLLKNVKISLDVESLFESIVKKVKTSIKAALRNNQSYAHGPNRRINIIERSPKNTTTPIPPPPQQMMSGVPLRIPSHANTSTETALTSRKRRRIGAADTIENYTGTQKLGMRPPKRQASLVESAFSSFGNSNSNNNNSNNNNNNNTSNTVYSNDNMLSQMKTGRTDSIGDAIEAIKIAERRHSENKAFTMAAGSAKMQEYQSAMNTAAGSAKMQEYQSAMNTYHHKPAGNSMAAAAEAVRLAEMENQLDSLGQINLLDRPNARNFMGERRNSNSIPFDVFSTLNSLRQDSPSASTADLIRLLEMNRRNSASSMGLLSDSGQSVRKRTSMTVASEAVQQMELEAAMRNNPGSVSAVDLAGIFDPYKDENHYSAIRRRSSYTLMDNVLNQLRRRSSAGNSSMAAAAEAVRLEMDAALRQRRSSAGNSSMAAAAEAVRYAEMESALRQRRGSAGNSSIGNSSIAAAAEAVRYAEMESALRNRRGSAGNSSMAAAAEAVRYAEMESAMNRPRRTSTGTISSMAAAAEVVRMSEAENMNIPSHYTRNYAPRNYLAQEDMMRDTTDDWNSMMMRQNGANNMISSATAAEALRLAEMESNGASYTNNLIPNQVMESQQRGGSRRRVSFRLDNSLHAFNAHNAMNGYQP